MTIKADDIRASDEWRKAVDYAIRDADIERQRELLGFDEAQKMREYIQAATIDTIRNFAHGRGNDNPLGLVSADLSRRYHLQLPRSRKRRSQAV